MLANWKPWLFAGASLVAGVGLGMSIGHLWARDHAGWVEATGTVVAAVGTIVAAFFAVRAFQLEIARMREENADRERNRAEAQYKDAQNVVVTCRPAGGGSLTGNGTQLMSHFSASWDVRSSVPATNVRVRIPPYIPEWQGIKDIIPSVSHGTHPILETNQYEIGDGDGYFREFEYRAEVRYTLAGVRWSRTGPKGDPIRIEGDDPDG